MFAKTKLLLAGRFFYKGHDYISTISKKIHKPYHMNTPITYSKDVEFSDILNYIWTNIINYIFMHDEINFIFNLATCTFILKRRDLSSKLNNLTKQISSLVDCVKI